jgi:hypothetical protein
MKPKDKAKELVDTYRIMLMNSDTECGEEILCTVIAKYCALIAVDEILNLMINNFQWDINYNGNIEYWQEVKQEIQAL